MRKELQDIKDAMERGDFATARDLADIYVPKHPGEFSEFQTMVDESATESEALANVVAACENLRNAGLTESHIRAEAFHLYQWEPQNIGGTTEPRVRAQAVHPTVRNK